MKKIYFAGAIRAGRDDVDVYRGIIAMLKLKYKVLTEHIADAKISSLGETELSDNEIYERDCSWIRECDFLVAEVTTASLGVGYEIGYAESLKKPIICLYREQEGKRLSAMLDGNKNIRVYRYKTLADLEATLNKI